MTTQTTSPDPAAEQLSKRAWGMLLVLCGALFLDAMDVSMIGVALPSIREDLGPSTSSLQWVVSAYVLGYGGFLLLGGRAPICSAGGTSFSSRSASSLSRRPRRPRG
jgi:MFS family permease